ncbi:conserved Plasmodium protein, unknown function [Plasmodium chabaudi chabaudi]|uniref:Uncharacterized protein n=1 Tax=Plasmodium chabaudi chabaudi TaxID=31271 RepID=A0A1C6YNB1_PLACU|nr:conserved Plasmodium protein, unknown function [Plasmodium chabaudi chabaudi]
MEGVDMSNQPGDPPENLSSFPKSLEIKQIDENAINTLSLDFTEWYQDFLNYTNYFFIENKNNIDIFFEVKESLKCSNLSLTQLLKNINLLSHVIYFQNLNEQNLLTSNDIEYIHNILYKNENNYSTTYTIVYNCIIFLTEVIRLSSHSGTKIFAYHQIYRSYHVVQKLLFKKYLHTNSNIKNSENFYVLKRNEAIFIENMIILNIIHMLNSDNKLLKMMGLYLCHIFINLVSQCNYIINFILTIIFQQIHYDEYTVAFSLLIDLVPYLSHDVLYYVIKKVYNHILLRPTHVDKTMESKKNKDNAQTNLNKPIKLNIHNIEIAKQIATNLFSYTACLFLGRIAIILNELTPYVSYFLFKQFWNIINKFIYLEYTSPIEENVVNIIDTYFYSTTILSIKNLYLFNLQIIILKLLLNISHTHLMTKRKIKFFTFRSILFLLKKKKIIPYISNKYFLPENKQFFKTNYFYFIYFTFILTIKNNEIIRWFNSLDLNDEPTKFMFIQIIYEISTIQNCLHLSKGNKTNDNQCVPSSHSSNHNFDQTFFDNCSSNIHDIYFDNFVNRFLTLVKGYSFEGEDKTKESSTNNYITLGKKIQNKTKRNTINDLPPNIIDRMNEVKNSNSVKKNEKGKQFPDHPEKGKFNFTINLSDEDKNNSNDNLKNEIGQNDRNIIKQYNETSLDIEKQIDTFFENLTKLAKENEQKKQLTIKELDINLVIKKNTKKKKKNEEKTEEQKKKKKKKSEEKTSYPSNLIINQPQIEGNKNAQPISPCSDIKSDGHTNEEISSIDSSISKSSLISEISNNINSASDNEMNTTPNNIFINKKNCETIENYFIHYCLYLLKKNKIKLGNLIRKDSLNRHHIFSNEYLQFKQVMKNRKVEKTVEYDNLEENLSDTSCPSKGKANNSYVPNDLTLKRILFIKILFFLYKHSKSILLKLHILKCLVILSKYIIFKDDAKNIVTIFNNFFVFLNIVNSSESKNNCIQNFMIDKHTSHSNSLYTQHLKKTNRKKNDEIYHDNIDNYQRIQNKYSNDFIYTSGTSNLYNTDLSMDMPNINGNNFEYILNELKNDINISIPSENFDFYDHYKENIPKSLIYTFLINIICKLKNSKSSPIFKLIFHNLFSNKFIQAFDIFFILKKEHIMEILKDPFFYLVEQREKSDINNSNMLGEKKQSNDIYFIKTNTFYKTFHLFQFEKTNFRNVKLLFYFSFFNFHKDKDIMHEMRKKTIIFLTILNNIFSFDNTHTKKKLCTSQVNSLNPESKNYKTQNEIDTKNSLRKLKSFATSISDNNSVNDIEVNITDKISCENDNYMNESGSGITTWGSSASYSSIPYSEIYSSYSSSDEKSENYDDIYSISSISNKSLKNRLVKNYKNLENTEKLNSEDYIKINNLKNDQNSDISYCSHFYLYKIGILCIRAGYFKYGYKIFEKLYFLVNNRDIKLWFKALENYAKFYYIKRKGEHDNNKLSYLLRPIKFLENSEQFIKSIYKFKDNFFHLAIFLKIQINIYKAIDNLLTLVNDIKDEINFTLNYFFYNIDKLISSLKDIMITILIILNIKYLFSTLSKKILGIYIVLVKSLFLISLFLKHKIVPYLFLSPSFLINTFTNRELKQNKECDEKGENEEKDNNEEKEDKTNKRICKNCDEESDTSSMCNIDDMDNYEQDRSNMVINSIHNFIRFYIHKKKEKNIRKKIFSKELKNAEGKPFNDVFDYIMAMWDLRAFEFFFYEHIQNLREIYDNLFKDGIINKNKIITFIKIYLTVIYKINYPTPPIFLSSQLIPFVESSTYIYRSNTGKKNHEIESMKCIGQLVGSKSVAISSFHYCNIKLVFKSNIIKETNVKSRGTKVIYTVHMKIEDDDLKYFNIFLTPLDKKKNLIGQAKATVFFFKYI